MGVTDVTVTVLPHTRRGVVHTRAGVIGGHLRILPVTEPHVAGISKEDGSPQPEAISEEGCGWELVVAHAWSSLGWGCSSW